MRILIEIECETISELISHLRAIEQQVKTERKKLKIAWDDELPLDTQLEDNNCYGVHELKVVPEPL